MRRETRRTGVFTRRALITMGAQVAMLGGLGVRLWQVQVAKGARYATLAEENRVSARLIAPPRGRILDRFGEVLAGSRLNWRALLIAEQTADVFVIANNHYRGKAPANALMLKRAIGGRRAQAPAALIEAYPELAKAADPLPAPARRVSRQGRLF